ncbi:MAG: type I-E CRISPR-associated protein Cas6/Cse3/CasE [Propionicimonas sp.]|nr:type I-E CRISPR-associated protein Cas6/Cse3/CasE [Propionicimonas sp.]
MYLTQMPLNPQRRSTHDLIVSPQRLHAAILAGFLPGVSGRSRVLWRLDTDGPHELNLYVVSAEIPSFDALAEQAGWTSTPVWRTAEYGPFLDRLRVGQRWVFRLVANPVRNVRDAPTGDATGSALPRGRRVPLIKEADQREWLLSRSEGLGFRVVDGASGGANLSVTHGRRRRFDRRKEDETWLVTLQTAQFDGVLEVTDVEALQETLCRGVGSGKGYGCGLMTLAPSS